MSNQCRSGGSIDRILPIASTSEQLLFATVPVEPRNTGMGELEFDRLLEMVSDAFGSDSRANDSREHEMCAFWRVWKAPPAANDNQTVWSLIPFPAGWGASC
jgi:hypothetical protein